MKQLYVLLLLAIPACLSAQQLERSILSSAGNESVNTISLEWTLGELAVTTVASSEIIFTQGYHQPEKNESALPGAPLISMKVWPNPTADFVMVSVSSEVDAKITLTDISGKLIQRNILSSSQKSIKLDLATVINGIYFITLRDNNGQIIGTSKISKIN